MTNILDGLDKITHAIAHRIEFPKLPPKTRGKGKAKLRRMKRKAGDVFRVEDSQRLGFREITLSPWDVEEIRGTVSLYLAGSVLTGYGKDGDPEFSSHLPPETLTREDWRKLFSACRRALGMDRMDGPGNKGRMASPDALNALAAHDFHAGTLSGAEPDVDPLEKGGAGRLALARLGREFRAALRAAWEGELLYRIPRRARAAYAWHRQTLRRALRAASGCGHGMDCARADGMASRSLHKRLAAFGDYVSAGRARLIEAACA